MKNIVIIITGIFLLYPYLHADISQPITTPIKWEGLDTLSKFYQFEQFKKQGNSTNNFEKSGAGAEIQDLITDPRVVYSSYFGGNGYDCSYGIAVDSKDNIILVGYSGSTNLPTTEGCFQKDKKAGHDAFIAKFTPDGQPVWITYYGGSGTDVAKGCVVDANDNIYVVGKTDSPDFPATKGAYKGNADAFILKFNSSGERLWSELYGSDGFDSGEGIALMSDGGIVITGYTSGINLSITEGALYKTLQGYVDAFVSRFSIDGELVWGSYYGGYENEITTCIATDKWDHIAVGGYHKTISSKQGMPKYPTTVDAYQKDSSQVEDGIFFVLLGDGKLQYSTFYGGHAVTVAKGDGKDIIYGIAYDDLGNLYCCGYTSSYDFPTTPTAFKAKYDSHDAFILKFSSTFNRQWATYYGGSETETGDGAQSISTDHNGNIYVTGWTNSYSFPVVGDSIQGMLKPGYSGTKIVLLKMDTNGNPIFSGYYGSGLSFGYNINVNNDNIYFTGECSAFSFPYSKNAFQIEKQSLDPNTYTSFITKINLKATNIINIFPEKNIIFYPNPTSERFIIKFLNNFEKIYNIQVFDMNGKLLFDDIINDISTEYSINIGKFPIGNYYVHLKLNNRTFSFKLVKN